MLCICFIMVFYILLLCSLHSLLYLALYSDFCSLECHKKNPVNAKEPASFGETLSKAFGKLTSFTKVLFIF